jgi:hypothetical protein
VCNRSTNADFSAPIPEDADWVAFGVLLARDIFNRSAHHGGTLFYPDIALLRFLRNFRVGFSEKNREIAMADIDTETQENERNHSERASREALAALKKTRVLLSPAARRACYHATAAEKAPNRS